MDLEQTIITEAIRQFGEKGLKKEIFLPPAPTGSQIAVFKCKCLQCGAEHILFDSRYHGYEGVFLDKPQEITDYTPSFRQVHPKCRLQVRVSNDPAEDCTEFSMEDFSNGFDWISIYAISETGTKTTVFDCETA